MVNYDRIGSGNMDGRSYTKGPPPNDTEMVRRGRPLNCKEIIRHPLRWWRFGLFAFLVVGPVWYAIIDDEPPYTRLGGVVTPPNPEPGGRAEIVWEIKSHRMCQPASDHSVVRRIIDAKGVVWDFAGVASIYRYEGKTGGNGNTIARVVDLPQGIALGPATYRSITCFVCDPFTLQRFWPVCVSKPDIHFTVGAPTP